jgi:hypothetical protein
MNADSLWIDEAVTDEYTVAHFTDIFTGRVVYDLGNPPLYFCLANAWSAFFGDAETGLRSLPTVFGVLTITFLGFLGRKLIGPAAGQLSAFLLAVSPTAIELSNEARPYALMGLLAVVSTWLFCLAIDRAGPIWWIAYSVAILLIGLTHYYAVFVPLAHLASLTCAVRDRGTWTRWIVAIAAAGVMWSAWLPGFLKQVSISGNLVRMQGRWVTQFLATPTVFALGRNLAWRESSPLLLLVVSFVSIMCFWLPAGIALWTLRRRPFNAALLGVWALCPIAVPLLAAVLRSPLYATRYAFVGLPPFLILVSEGLLRFQPRLRLGLLALGLGFTCLSLFSYARGMLKDDWRAETRYVLDALRPEEVVVFDPDHEATTFFYYAKRYGSVPKTVYCLSYRKGEAGMTGSRFDRGAKSEEGVRVRDSEIFSSSGVWLITCVPQRELGAYEGDFEAKGFRCDTRRASRRINIRHFVRAGTGVRWRPQDLAIPPTTRVRRDPGAGRGALVGFFGDSPN